MFSSFILFGVFSFAAYAQNTRPVTASVMGKTTQQDAQQLLNILNDPKKREEFSKTLALMVKVLPATQKTAEEQPVTIDSYMQIEWHGVLRIARVLQNYAHDFMSLCHEMRAIGVWFHEVIHRPDLRKMGVEVFSSAFLVLSIALVLEHVTSIALRKPLQKVTYWAQAHQMQASKVVIAGKETTPLRQVDYAKVLHYVFCIPYALVHFFLKLVPVGVCLLLGYLGAGFLSETDTDKARLVTITLVNAYVGARVLYLVVETLLAQQAPAIRIVPVSDSTARLLTQWWNVLVAIPSTIICLPTLGRVFDLPPQGEDIMLCAVSLVQHLIIAIFLWRIRDIISQMLQPSPGRMKSIIWACVGSFVRLWWVIAIVLDMILWFVWAIHLQKDYQWLLYGLVWSFFCLVFSWVFSLLIYGLQDRLFRVSVALQEQYPNLQKRVDFYYPFVRYAITAIIIFTTMVALAQCWQLPVLNFLLTSNVGARFTNASFCFLTGIVVAVLTWECVNGLLNRQIMRYMSSDRKSHGARLRTILPIIRTTLLVIIIVLVLLTTLAQMGINVAPLLTGAGILGVGLSFGSQSLVKDVITGFFMLAEDAIQVGDWVTTEGIEGEVEYLSIRSLRVRSFDGDLHIIPFSSVTSIANTAREFNRVIVRVTLDVGEDSKRVVKIFKDAVEAMRQEDEYNSIIFSDYIDHGIEKADQNGAVLLGVIKTAPMMKWKVQSDFYRRVCPIMTQMDVQFFVNIAYSTTPPNMPLHVVMSTEKEQEVSPSLVQHSTPN
ncbi:MAG: mechanosensitive ion channel [Acetobacter sp.]|nr:mechanosensitive ion channel [Acetobacter sp.]